MTQTSKNQPATKSLLGRNQRSVLAALALGLALSLGATATATAGKDKGKREEKKAAADIVDTAVAAGSFKTLAAALTAADLIDTLRGAGPFTVFAPTDEAFAKIPKAELDALLKDKAKLRAVLTYHVVPGKLLAADVVKQKSLKTVQGASATVDTSKGARIDGANIVKTDILASNGVIHVIDTVILPKQ